MEKKKVPEELGREHQYKAAEFLKISKRPEALTKANKVLGTTQI